MAIDTPSITSVALSSCRSHSTEPLHPSDPFIMTIPLPNLPEGQDICRIPGVLVQGGDPAFADGYTWGRWCYFNDVIEIVNADGVILRGGGYTEEDMQTGKVREVKVRDVTIPDILQYIQDVLENGTDMSESMRIGHIVGYIATCTEQFYGLLCSECDQPKDLCHHQPIPERVQVQLGVLEDLG